MQEFVFDNIPRPYQIKSFISGPLFKLREQPERIAFCGFQIIEAGCSTFVLSMSGDKLAL
jgi:hypothetical protein